MDDTPHQASAYKPISTVKLLSSGNRLINIAAAHEVAISQYLKRGKKTAKVRQTLV